MCLNLTFFIFFLLCPLMLQKEDVITVCTRRFPFATIYLINITQIDILTNSYHIFIQNHFHFLDYYFIT